PPPQLTSAAPLPPFPPNERRSSDIGVPRNDERRTRRRQKHHRSLSARPRRLLRLPARPAADPAHRRARTCRRLSRSAQARWPVGLLRRPPFVGDPPVSPLPLCGWPAR